MYWQIRQALTISVIRKYSFIFIRRRDSVTRSPLLSWWFYLMFLWENGNHWLWSLRSLHLQIHLLLHTQVVLLPLLQEGEGSSAHQSSSYPLDSASHLSSNFRRRQSFFFFFFLLRLQPLPLSWIIFTGIKTQSAIFTKNVPTLHCGVSHPNCLSISLFLLITRLLGRALHTLFLYFMDLFALFIS